MCDPVKPLSWNPWSSACIHVRHGCVLHTVCAAVLPTGVRQRAQDLATTRSTGGCVWRRKLLHKVAVARPLHVCMCTPLPPIQCHYNQLCQHQHQCTTTGGVCTSDKSITCATGL